jgi:hypothetical protein
VRISTIDSTLNIVERMKSLIAAMLLWIGANTGYDVDLPHPVIKIVTQQELERIYSKGAGTENHLHGFYDRKEDIIYLPDTWKQYDPWSQGVLLHELVHYVQDQNQAKFQCTNEMEKESWPLQKQYLLEYHGYVWDYDELWFAVISNCSYH